MDRKVLTLGDVVFKADETTGIIEGICNVGNQVDLQGDNVLPGAWSRVVASGQEPPFLWNHNTKDLDVRGKVIYLEELLPGDQRIPLNRGPKAVGNASGLRFKAQMALKTEKGRDAFELLRGGFIKQLSVYFNNKREDQEVTRDGVRNVKMVNELYEISAVLKGASQGTAVLLAKALEMTKDEHADWQAIHDLACANKAACSVAEKHESPTEPSEEATAPNVTELTAYALAFGRAYGELRGNQI